MEGSISDEGGMGRWHWIMGTEAEVWMTWSENCVDIWPKSIPGDGSHSCVQGPAGSQGGRKQSEPGETGSEEQCEAQVVSSHGGYWKNWDFIQVQWEVLEDS